MGYFDLFVVSRDMKSKGSALYSAPLAQRPRPAAAGATWRTAPSPKTMRPAVANSKSMAAMSPGRPDRPCYTRRACGAPRTCGLPSPPRRGNARSLCGPRWRLCRDRPRIARSAWGRRTAAGRRIARLPAPAGCCARSRWWLGGSPRRVPP